MCVFALITYNSPGHSRLAPKAPVKSKQEVIDWPKPMGTQLLTMSKQYALSEARMGW